MLGDQSLDTVHCTLITILKEGFINIAIFSECYKPTINGVVISIESFRQELEKRGHKVFIFAPSTKKSKDSTDAHIFRFPSFELPIHAYYPIGIPISKKIFKVIPYLKLDIIHAQSIFNISRYGRSVARGYQLPFLVTYHTLIEEYVHYVPFFRGMIQKKIVQWSRDFCNSADQVIVPTPTIKKVLQKYQVKKPIAIIPTGTDISQYKKCGGSVLRKKLKISRNEKILIYVGRLAKEKNIDFLLQTFRFVLDKGLKAHLIIIGGGPEENRYKRVAAKLDLLKKITFTGYLPKPKTNALLGASDLLVFPSLTDTQGLVITEAFASGIPVVALAAYGPKDIIQNGKTGLLAKPKITDFATKIGKLIRYDSTRLAMGRRAKNWVKKNYSIQICTDRLEKLYKKLYNRKTKV